MGENTLELDVVLNLQLDSVDESIFKKIEASAQKAGKSIEASLNKSISGALSKLNRALSFTNVFLAIKSLQGAFRALENVIGKVVKATNTMVEASVKGFATMVSEATKLTSKLSGLSSVANIVKNAFSNIKSSITSAFAQFSLTDVIKESLSLASALDEVQNVVDQVFGESAETINKFAETAIDSLGMTTLQAKQFAGKFGAALRAAGQTTTNVKDMSVALTQLTSDLASFYDIEQSVASEKLMSGVISGQIKPLREFGVDLSNAAMQAYATSQGITTLYKDMSLAEKQALRFKKTMSDLAVVHGDYARTIDSTANQVRLLKNRLAELGAYVGKILNVVFNPLLHVLNNVVAAITRVMAALAALVGKKFNINFGGSKGGASGLADAYDDASESAEDFADSEDDVAKSTKKAAAEAKKALAPFHKLNVLQNKASESSSGGDSKKALDIGGFSFDTGDATGALDDFSMSVEEFKKAVEKALDDLLKKADEFFKDMPKKVQDFFDKVQPWVDWLATLYNKIWKALSGSLGYNIGATIGEVFEGIFRTLNTWMERVDYLLKGKAIANILNGIIDNVDLFKEAFSFIANAIMSGYETLLGFAREFHWETFGKNIYEGLKEGLTKIKPEVIYESLITFLQGITTTINTFFDNLLSDSASIQKIADTIVAYISAAADYISSDEFATMVDNIFNFLTTMLGTLNEKLADANVREKISQGLTTLISKAIEFAFSDEYLTYIENLWGIVGDTLANVKEILEEKGILEKIKTGLYNFIHDAWEGAKSLILGMFDKNGDGDIWDEIWQSIASAIDTDGNGEISDNIAKAIKAAWEEAKKSISEFFNSEEIPLPLKIAPIVGIIAKIASAVAPLISIISTAVTWVGNLIAAFGGGGAAAGAAGGAAGGGGLAAAIEALSGPIGWIILAITTCVAAFADLWHKSEEFRQAFIDIWEGIKEKVGGAVDKLKESFEALQPVFNVIIDVLSGLWTIIETVLAPALVMLGETLGNLFSGLIDTFTGLFEILGGLVNGFLEGDWTLFTQGIEDFFGGILEIITAPFIAAFETLDYIFKEWGTSLEEVWTSMVDFFKGIWDGVTEFFSELWNGIKDIAQTVWDAICNIFYAAVGLVYTIWEGVANWFNDTVWQPILNLLQPVITAIDDFFQQCWDTIQSIWNAVAQWFDDTVWQPLTTAVDTLWQAIVDFFTQCWEAIQGIWNAVADWFETEVWKPIEDTANTVVDAITGVFEDAVSAIEGAWEGLTSFFDNIFDTIGKGVDWLVDKFTKLVDKGKEVLGIKSNVSSSGNSSSLSVRGYATGGVFLPNRPQLAILGDQRSGVNVESPLSTMVDAFRQAAADLTSGGFSGNITIPIYVDGVLSDQKVITASQMHNYRSNGR